MKTMLHRLCFLSVVISVLLFLLSSCEKETVLTIDQTSLSFTDAGESQSVSLTANKPWSVKSDQSWCKVSPSSGEEAASNKISISCDANTTYDARNCTVTFTCAELTKTLSISQATNNGLLVSQTSYELTKAAQQLEIQVQANVKFSVEVDASCKDWVKYKTTKGLTTSTVVLEISENKTYDSREGKVTIKENGGSLSSTITIKQNQLDGLFVTTPEYNLSNEKHTLTVEVSTNVEFEVKSEADWVKYVQTKGLNTKQIVLEVAENETYDQRETKVNVKQKNGNLCGTITIKQNQTNGLFVSPKDFNLTEQAQTVEIEIKNNVTFDVIIPEEDKSWISVQSNTQTKALVADKIVLAIEQNSTYDNREASVTIKQTNGSLCETVTIKQSQTNGLFVTTPEYNLSNEKHTLTVEVSTNVEFDVKPEADWVRYVQTKGLNSKQIVLEVAENETYDQREAKVIVKQKNGDLSGTIAIKQGEKFGLFLSQTEFDLSNDAHSIDVEVKANVDYDIIIPSECKDWVKLMKTKSLNTKNCTFSISKNETYDAREGSITFKQKNGALSGTVSIKQAQTDAIIVEHDKYSLTYEEQQLSINISSNVDYEVIIDEECTRWINRISTKGLKEESVVFQVAENEGDGRSGKITFKSTSIQKTVLVQQQAGIVLFDDDLFEEYCVTNFDKNGDGKVSYKESLDVEQIDVYCRNNIKSLKGIEYFINLQKLRCGWNSITSLDVSHNTSLTHLGCDNNKLKSLDVSNNTALQELACFSNELSSLDVSNNLALTKLTCGWNNISSIDISRNTALTEFGCDANPLKSLDVSQNTALTFLACYRDGLTSLDISHNTQLRELTCFENQLKNLELSHNTKLTRLECNDNELTSLDVSNNINLNILKCENNPLLKDIWLRKGQTISSFTYDSSVATIHYKYYSENFGDLAKLITPMLGTAAIDTITTMWVLGNISSDDFKVLNELPKLQYLDLSSASLMDNKVPEQAFINNYELTSIILPEDVETIGSQAFMNCINLNMIEFPSALTTIDTYAFYGCSNMKGELILPKSLIQILEGGFASCLGLSGNLIIPQNMRYIGTNAFIGCTGLNGELVFSTKEQLSIGERAFSGCSNFTGDLVIPKNVFPGSFSFEGAGFTGSLYVHNVGWYTFYSCTIGENLIVCDDVTHLGNAFRFITVNGYTYIGKGAISLSGQCFSPNNCNVFYVAAVTPPACENDAITLYGKYLGVPKGRVEVYEAAAQWNTAATIEEADFSKLKLQP